MVDNVGTDLLQNFSQLLEQKISFNDLLDKSIEMIYAFSEILHYFNNLIEKYYSLFGGSIMKIGIYVNQLKVDKIEDLGEIDIVKYRY